MVSTCFKLLHQCIGSEINYFASFVWHKMFNMFCSIWSSIIYRLCLPFIWHSDNTSYNSSFNLSIYSFSFIRVMHPTICPDINFSTWWQGFCLSVCSVGEQRPDCQIGENYGVFFRGKSSLWSSHHLLAPEISLIGEVGGARKLILDNLTS